MFRLTKIIYSLVVFVVSSSFQTASANNVPNSSCTVGQPVPINSVGWDDNGAAPWAAAEPANLVDGQFGAWHTALSTRRVQFDLDGEWNIKELQYHDSWGDGNLLLSTQGNAVASINTAHYPLGWYSQTVSLPQSDTAYLNIDSQNLKIDEIQLCGTPANNNNNNPNPSNSNGPGVASCDAVPNAEIIPVTASWAGGQNAIAPWRFTNPDLLIDGEIVTQNNSGFQYWFHYWENSGSTQTPVLFSFPANYDIAAIRWHDHYGKGNATLSGNGQSTTLMTDRWPLDWHVTNTSISNVSTVQMTLDSSDVKLAEITFCGTPSGGTTPPTTTPTTPNTPTTPPTTSVQDGYTQSAHIIDSFGQTIVPDDSGNQWNAVREYYNKYYASAEHNRCLLYTSPSPRDATLSRMPSSA